MTSLIKIEFEAENSKYAIKKLNNIIEDLRNGLIEGEGWEVLSNFVDSLENDM